MRILLINTSFPGYFGKDLFPLGIGYLAGVAKKFGEAKVIDLNVEEFDLKEIKKFSPDLVGISSTTPSFHYALEIGRKLKEEGIKIVFGGTHVSFRPEQALEIGSVVKGEGEIAFKKILETPSFLEKNSVFEEAAADLDRIDFPAFDLFDMGKYKIMSVITSRGCPFSCSYCCASKFWNGIRFRSIENVLEELMIIKNYGIERIKFHDSTFTLNKERTIKLCEKMEEEKLELKWSCETKAETLDREVLEKMGKAGCLLICIGVDSGSEEILKNINRPTDLEKLKSGFKKAKEAGINTRAYATFGLPGETEENVKKTIALLREIKPYQIMLSLATAYPGTELEKGKKVILDRDWIKKFDGHGLSSDLFLSETLSKEEYRKLGNLLWEEVRKIKKESRKEYSFFKKNS